MNLNDISPAPHAEGFIKVACETDPMLADKPRTRNEFLITMRHHAAAPQPQAGQPGRLADHPLQASLSKQDEEAGRAIVKEIPIKLFFNSAKKALKVSYQAYSSVRNIPVCSGNGKDAKRLKELADSTSSVETVPCPGPERCAFAQSGEASCQRQVRMSVQIDGQANPFTVFEVRTSSLNSYRALSGQLQMIEARFKGLRHVPLKLTIWEASNEASGYQPFSLMRLDLNATNELEAIKATLATRKEYEDAGLDDDIDAVMDGNAEHDQELGVATLDFDGMSELYRAPVSRTGARPVGEGRGQTSRLASELIAKAVAGATPAPVVLGEKTFEVVAL